MRILYLSCHSILEYDEIKMLSEMGHYVFSPGAYVEPENPGDMSLRPGLYDIKYDPEDVELWHKLSCPGKDNKECLTREFADRFDAIIIMHLPKWIHVNWEQIKHKMVIWRTIGQSVFHNEAELARYRKEGLKIVRYSPRERLIPGYIGEDALIRFYKDPEEFGGWVGGKKEIITFGQHMEKRGAPTNFVEFELATRDFPRALFGPGSESLSWGKGKVSYDELKRSMQDYRVYFYTGTWPASYTLNFIEAFMTGIPMVCIGPKKGHPHGWFKGHDLYEIPDIIENGANGFYSDSMSELRSYIKELLDNKALADEISAAGRATAVSIFGKDNVKARWHEYLNSL